MLRPFLLFIAILVVNISFATEEITAYHLSTTNELPDNDIRHIASDRHGFLYLTSKYHTWQYDGYSYRQMNDSIFRYYQAKSGDIQSDAKGWITDNRGNKYKVLNGNVLYREHTTGKSYSFNVYDKRIATLVNSLKVFVISDKDGKIWASVNGNGVFIYDKKSGAVKHLCAANDDGIIDYDMIVAIHEDHNGDIWVSQEHYGIVRLRYEQQAVSVVFLDGEKHSPSYSNVRMMQKMEDGRFLIANNTGSIMIADETMQEFTTLNMPEENYLSACIDAEGRLWLGTRQHGVLIEGERYSDGRIDCIYRDRNGLMWIGGITNDLKVLRNNNGEMSEEIVLSGIAPRFLYEDTEGTVWLCADTGLYIFRPKELLNDKSKIVKLMDVPTRTVFEDSRHRIWIGSENKGLITGDLKSRDITDFEFLTTADGLPNNVVQGIIGTGNGTICITTEDGCAFLDSDSRNVLRTIYFNDEVRRNFYNERCIANTKDGRIALGSLDGIIILDTLDRTSLEKSLRSNLPVRITGLTINGVPTYEMGDDSPIKGEISDTKEITLPHNQNSLTLFFSDFTYGDRIRTDYSYRMIGVDEAWSEPSELNFATFRDLKPGKYTFQLRHRQHGGKWSDNEQLMSITILPPIWASWGAIALYTILAIGIIIVVYRYAREMYSLRRDMVVERQLTEYKLKFFTNISHEFRTPLTIIRGSMERMMNQGAPANMKMPLSNINRSVARMSRLLNQLLEFRKMQDGKLSLALQETEVVGFVRDIWDTFAEVAEEKHISKMFLPQKKEMTAYIDRGHLDKIVHNLLSNAYKYTPEGGSVTLAIRQEGDMMKLVVTDTGIGITPEKKKELFSRFVTGKVSADSIGIGLNLTWELARTHHGSITHEDNPEGGCIFTVSIPTNRTEYENEDFMKEKHILLSSHQEPQKAGRRYNEMTPSPMNNLKVLIAEDDTDIALLLRSILSKYFIVEVAHDGVEAWEKLQTSPDYKLLLTDAMMPRMNGYDLIRKIRHDQNYSLLPVVMLTALDSESDQVKALGLGVDAFISKPFNTEVLTAQCLNLLNRERKDDTSQQQSTIAGVTDKHILSPKLITEEKDKMFLRQLDKAIMERIDDPTLNMEMMSALFGMGKTPFYQRVKMLTGDTPATYVRNLRLQRAYELLISPTNTMNIQQVALSVGFSNSQHFSVAFKKKYGISPKHCS